MTEITPPPAPSTESMPDPSFKIYVLAKSWDEELGARTLTKADFNSLSRRRVLSNGWNAVTMFGASVYAGVQASKGYGESGFSGGVAFEAAACLVFALLARRASRIMRADRLLQKINKAYGPAVAQDVIKETLYYNKNNKLTRDLKS